MAVIHQRISLDSPGEWNNALKGVKHGFGHTWEHCYAMHLTTGYKTYLYSFEKGGIRIVCPIAEREYAGYVDIVKPFGFSGFVGNEDCPEFQQYWKQFTQEKGYVCGYLGFDPIFDSSSHYDSGEIYQYDTVFVMDLTLSIDEIYANMEKDRRKRVRQSDRIASGLVLEKPVLTEFFLKNYYDFLRSKNASSVYFFSEKTLQYLLDLDNVILMGIEDSGKVVTVMVLTYTADLGNFSFLVTLPEGQRYSTAIYWYGIKHFKSIGVPLLNLGGGGGSVGDFKRRFGSKELPLKCLKQIYRPDVYESLCRKANVDYKDMTGYFPAYRLGQPG